MDEAYLDRTRAYHQTEPYQKAMRKRTVWVEPVFAEAKLWHGMRRFRLRRLWRVSTEAMMFASVQNLKRLLNPPRSGRTPASGMAAPVPDRQGASSHLVRILSLDLMTTVRTTRAALPVMVAQGSGAIVNVSAAWARLPQAEIADYSAAKAAITNLTRMLAEEFTAKGVRVTAVAPGPVSTEAWVGPGGVADAIAQASGTTREQIVEQTAQLKSMTIGRMIAPEEVATLVLFLASDRAAAITGVEYLIDGGMVKTT